MGNGHMGTPLPMNRQTYHRENITFPQLRWRVVRNLIEILYTNIPGSSTDTNNTQCYFYRRDFRRRAGFPEQLQGTYYNQTQVEDLVCIQITAYITILDIISVLFYSKPIMFSLTTVRCSNMSFTPGRRSLQNYRGTTAREPLQSVLH